MKLDSSDGPWRWIGIALVPGFAFFLILLTIGVVPYPKELQDLWYPWSAGNNVSDQKLFAGRDGPRVFLPMLQHVRWAASQGELPYWNTYDFCGNPGLASNFYAPFDLFHAPAWFLEPPRAITVAWLLQFIVASIGMYALLRGYGMPADCAMAGGLVYSLGFSFVITLQDLVYFGAASWLPAMISAARKILYGRRPAQWSGFLAILVAACLLSGQFEVSFYALCLGCFICFAEWIFCKPLVSQEVRSPSIRMRPTLSRIALIAGAVLFALFISAPQILPTAELAAQSPRGVATGAALRTLPLESLTHCIHPRLFDRSSNAGIAPLTLGLLPFVACAYGFIASDWRTRYFWVSSIAFVMVWATTGLAYIVLQHLPMVRSMHAPERMILFLPAVVAIPAARGLSYIFERTPNRPALSLQWWEVVILLLLLVFTIAPGMAALIAKVSGIETILGRGAIRIAQLKATWSAPSAWGFLLANTAAIVLVLAARRFLMNRVAAILMWSVIFVVQTGSYVGDIYYYTPTSQILPETPGINYLKQHAGNQCRIALLAAEKATRTPWITDTAPSNTLSYHGIRQVLGFASLYPARHLELEVATDNNPDARGRYHSPYYDTFDANVLSRLAVRYVVVRPDRKLDATELTLAYPGPDLRIYENRQALDRVYLTTDYTIVEGDAASIAAMREPGDLRRLLVDARPSFKAASTTDPGQVAIQAETANSVIIRCTPKQPSLLAFLETKYPGWRAFVDGAEVPIHFANYIGMGIEVPQGEHEVTFHFAPTNMSWWFGTSLLGMLGAIGFLALGSWKGAS